MFADFDNIFMKHKTDISKFKIAKHKYEIEPNAEPYREDARRMSPDKAANANHEVENILALGLIQPLFSPWASDIVIVKTSRENCAFVVIFALGMR